MRIGLGMAALGRPGYINLNRDSYIPPSSSRTIDAMQELANTVMDELFRQCHDLNNSGDNGDKQKFIPWLDCARSYGLSEKFVGEYLRSNNISPDNVYVSSKWGYTYVANWKVSLGEGESHEIKDHSVENFLKQVQETEEYLGPYLNLYQVHSATFESGILTNTKVHEALDRCRSEKGWKIGLSVSGPNQDEIIREALKIRVPSSSSLPSPDEKQQSSQPPKRLFDSVQCTYNVLEQKPSTALLEAHNTAEEEGGEGIDIIIKEGLANGRALLNPTLVNLSKRMNVLPDQLALAAILAQPFQPRVLSGAVTVDQLRSNLAAFYPLSDGQESADVGVAERLLSTDEGGEILKELMEGCRMESETYWKDRAALAWN